MCLCALAWCKIPRVVWASSINTIRASGIKQNDIPAKEAILRAHQLVEPELFLGGVLAEEMDKRVAIRAVD
jgi:tRNA(adenine34) deaminase